MKTILEALRKRMLLILVLLLAGLVLPQTGQAQRGGPGGLGGDPEERVNEQVAVMTTELGLTDEQQPKVKEILLATAKARRDLFADLRDRGASRRAVRQAMQDLQKEQDEKLADVLTKEQIKGYAELQEKWRSERGGRRGGRRNG